MHDIDLIDLIYEAAAVPELWPKVLGRLSGEMDGDGGILFTANSRGIKWTASADISPLFDEFLRDGWSERNPRPVRFGRAAQLEFVRDHDHFTEEEMRNDPVYRDFFRKRGLGYALGTMLNVPSGDSIILTFERSFEKGYIADTSSTRMNALRPHLARASLLSSRLGLERARAMADALESIGLAAAVLRGNGAVYACNPMFDALFGDVFQDTVSGIRVKNVSDHHPFLDALQGVTNASGLAKSVPLRSVQGQPSLIVHLLPIRRAATDVFNEGRSLLLVTPVDRRIVPSTDVVSGLFDLTASEARVAQELAKGAGIKQISAAFSLSEETVRTYVKRIFAKTGTARQADLVALLVGLNVLPRTDQ